MTYYFIFAYDFMAAYLRDKTSPLLLGFVCSALKHLKIRMKIQSSLLQSSYLLCQSSAPVPFPYKEMFLFQIEIFYK